MIFQQYGNIFTYLFGIVLIFIALRLFFIPAKLFFRLILNAVLGIAGLFIINWLGSYADFYIAVNAVTIAVGIFLGLPGIVLLAILQWIGI